MNQTTSTTPECWSRLRLLFNQAIDLASPARERFLALQCGDDETLREQLESLLRASGVDLQFEQRVDSAIASAVHTSAELQPGHLGETRHPSRRLA